VIERSREIFARGIDHHSRDSYNEQLHLWRLSDGRLIELAACQQEKHKEKQRGRPRDLYVFDEATQFSETQVRFITGWNRTTRPGQRCRVVLCFNPPTDEPGRWVIRFFLPWMAYLYPTLPECEAYRGTPAAPGELRWYAMLDGVEQEVAADYPKARSRTFLPARVEDNPFLMAQGYDATLEALPEPLRSQMRYGDFTAGATGADPWQVIPAAWVRAAQQRWRERPQPTGTPSALGADIVRGGQDRMAIATLYGTWCAPLDTWPGVMVADGPAAAGLVVQALGGATSVPVGVDVIGIGSSCYDSLVAVDVSAIPVNNSEGAPDARDRSGKLRFRNVRAASYWALREALDPQHGDDLALPDDPELLADLCSPRYKVTTGGVLIESKDDIKARIGRSPDKGDALVIAHWVVGQGSWLVWGG
jgi:hypothetical protein